MKKLILLSVSAILLVSSGCGKKGGPNEGGEWAVNVIAFKSISRPIEEKISLVGTMAANESVEIQSEIDGVVENIQFEEGEAVQKGQILFQIDKEKLKAKLAQAEANLKMAAASRKRYEQLAESKSVSGQEVDQAVATFEANAATVELTKEELKDATILAPFEGVMGARLVSLGQFVSKGTKLTSLVDEDPMKAEFNVPERFLSVIQKGQKVSIEVAAYPGESFAGKVYFISPEVEELTRTTLVKALIPNPDSRLKSGMFATLRLIVNVKQRAVVIPETAVTYQGDNAIVFVVGADNRIDQRTVKTGVTLAGMVEIAEGVKEGEVVVVEGTQKVRPGALVNVKYKE